MYPSFSLQLQKQTGARIDVDTEDVGDERVLLLSGFPVQVCKAKAAIHQILTENTPVSEQLSVPQRSVGRIIGTMGPLPLFPFSVHLPYFDTVPGLFPSLPPLTLLRIKGQGCGARALLFYRTSGKAKCITSRSCMI